MDVKVKCDLCGTKFDLQRNGSVCPNCAYHYHVDGESQRNFSSHTTSHSNSSYANYGSSADGFAQDQMRQEKFETFIDDIKYSVEKNTTATSYDMHKDMKKMSHNETVFTPRMSTYSSTNNIPNRINTIPSGNGRNNLYVARSSSTNGTNKLNKALAVIVAIAVILFVVIIIMSIVMTESLSGDDETVVNEYEYVEKEPTLGQVTDSIGFDCGIFEIEDMSYESEEFWNEVEGYCLLSMKFSFQAFGNYEGMIYESVDVYVVTNDGQYIEPVSTYSLRDTVSIDTYELVDGKYNVCDDVYYNEGVMYFAVKPEDVASVFINEYDESGNLVESYNLISVEKYLTEE